MLIFCETYRRRMESLNGIGGDQDRGDQVQQSQNGVGHQLNLDPGQLVELLDNVEQVHDEQEQREPEPGHGHRVEEGGPRDHVEVRHLDANEADQVEHDHGHLHQPLLRPPVRGVIADLRRNDGLSGRCRGGRVLAREGDIGGGSGGHLKGEG